MQPVVTAPTGNLTLPEPSAQPSHSHRRQCLRRGVCARESPNTDCRTSRWHDPQKMVPRALQVGGFMGCRARRPRWRTFQPLVDVFFSKLPQRLLVLGAQWRTDQFLPCS